MNIGFRERLKELRLENGLLQRQLAEKINVSHGTISNWEVGRQEPGLKDIFNLANYFNVSVDYLLGFSDYEESYYTPSSSQYKKHLHLLDEMTADERDQTLDFMDELLKARKEYEAKINRLRKSR